MGSRTLGELPYEISRGQLARDVDLGVLTHPALSVGELMELRADAARAAPIDLVSINDSSIVLAHEIADSGICLYARTPDVETDFVTRPRATGTSNPIERNNGVWRASAWRSAVLVLSLEAVISRLEELCPPDPRELRSNFQHAWAAVRDWLARTLE